MTVFIPLLNCVYLQLRVSKIWVFFVVVVFYCSNYIHKA